MTTLITIVVYFLILLAISRFTGQSSNDAFFRGNRQSPWPLVAFGMVGASISGVSFVSVPGMAIRSDMTYLQMCMGFIVGYIVVAFLLIPLYYRYRLTSIYTWLDHRYGTVSRKTGAWFFIISKLCSSAAKLYLACLILQSSLSVSFPVIGSSSWAFPIIAATTLVLIWAYTHRNGIGALVWTDSLQTLCMLVALVLIIAKSISMLGMGPGDALQAIWNDTHSRIFEFSDWSSSQHFVKQFLSGIFVVIVMTGLDQDMMQKNLTCRTKRDAQKDLCSYGLLFLPVNFLLLSLGILLMLLHTQNGTMLPTVPDQLLPAYVVSGSMGQAVVVFFTIGVVASAFSSADSALTALTTSFCIDILDIDKTSEAHSAERIRKRVHAVTILVALLAILAFKAIGTGSAIDLIYMLVGYTYGPLLGLFAFGILTRRMPRERFVPFIAILSPVLCYMIDRLSQLFWNYRFGYELLLLNGLITFIALACCTTSKSKIEATNDSVKNSVIAHNSP